MTSHWNDMANSDYTFIIGGNPAANHPASFGHIMAAKDKGGKIIVVDPRFTQSAAVADIYAPMRSGTDIAFIGGMVNYIISKIESNPEQFNMTYITEYTNAPLLINPDYQGPADLDGLFSGYEGSINETDNAKRRYTDRSTWQYQVDENGVPKQDKTLKDPNCVFQILKRHYARYTPGKVCSITGTPEDKFLEICQMYAGSGAPDKSGVIIYAMGTTQHTKGTQNVRAYSILQLLLSNIGVAGGGVAACRGEPNVQGSTDHCLLYHILPGYLPAPVSADIDLQAYKDRTTPQHPDPRSLNWWQNRPKYIVSLLKAWYGENATAENGFGFNYLPKAVPGRDYSYIPLFEDIDAGSVKGMMVWGMNPAVAGPNSNLQRGALGKLDWLMCIDLWQTETGEFWKRPGVNPADIQTEVFMLPACNSYEKEGSVSNSGRWVQWRYKAANPPGDAKEDAWVMNKIMMKLKELYAAEGGPSADSILKLDWNYGESPDARAVAREVNGYDLTTGKLVASFPSLKDDGTTSSGNWLYCGSYTEEGNLSMRRDLTPDKFNIGLFSKFAWCWPVNRRVLYNRASVDLDGVPWNKDKPVIWWQDGSWVGDVPDGGGAPMAEGGHYPFIMKDNGFASLFGAGLADGPLPEHYEPWESPTSNALSSQQVNPVAVIWRPDEQGTVDDYPIACSTYRICEHWQSGALSRNLPWLAELCPEPFIEISEELAAEKGIENADMARVKSKRGEVVMRALVTKRFKPFQMNGKTIHQIGMIWHFGYTGLVTGDSANVLTSYIGDPITTIPEYKAFLVNVEKA